MPDVVVSHAPSVVVLAPSIPHSLVLTQAIMNHVRSRIRPAAEACSAALLRTSHRGAFALLCHAYACAVTIQGTRPIRPRPKPADTRMPATPL